MLGKLLISFFIFVFSGAAVGVSAQDGAQNDRPSSATPSQNAIDRDKRIAERIGRLKTDLDQSQIERLKARCSTAQKRIAKLEEKAKAHGDNQDTRLISVIEKISALGSKLKDSGQDVTALERDIDSLQKQKSKLGMAYQGYLTALADAKNVDCESNPEGFRTSVDDAKEKFRELKKIRTELRNYLVNDLKPTFIELIESRL
jgi:chromosome segregation ATPase